MSRFGLELTPAGIYLDYAEFSTGRSVLPPFEELGWGQRGLALVGIVLGSRQLWNKLVDTVGGWRQAFRRHFNPQFVDPDIYDLTADIMESSARLVEHGPLANGVLHGVPIGRGGRGHVADTFRNSTYLQNDLIRPVKLYRTYSDPGRYLGPFWSRIKPISRTQTTMDSAILNGDFGNYVTHYTEITVPAGERIFEGIAAPMRNGPLDLLGGGSQVYVNRRIPDAWVDLRDVPITQ